MPHIKVPGGRRWAALLTAVVLSACGSSPPPPPSITVTFVRHAQSAGNASGLIDTSVPGPSLTALGEQQAQQAADTLRTRNFDGIFASSMVRTQQTAAPLARDLGKPVQVLPGLRELEAGTFEGTPEASARSTYFEAPEQWLKGNRNARIPGSVDGNQFNDRFTAAMQTIYDSGDKNPVAFAHGGSIMLWTMMNVHNPRDSLLQTNPLPNTGEVVVRGNPSSGWTLVDWDGIETEP
ncbi:MAG TPA: histidine phosphatase family protein [Mycobacterium sp.]|nr:histidine phosphatase family protein [Mycobacterium sp.]